MAITPIAGVEQLGTQLISTVKQNENKSDSSFDSILREALESVGKAEQTASVDRLGIAAGQEEGLHTIPLNIAKADLAVQTMVAVRNKVLDAYNEVMRITL